MAKKQNSIDFQLLSNNNDFQEFIDSIKTESANYDYVCVRGKRCFNIISRFLPNIDFITFSALMLQYNKLADYYQENERFPKILLIDDLLFDGREMACDLFQLENILTEELLNRGAVTKKDNYRYIVHKFLAASTNIYAYIKTKGVLFIEDKYLNQLYFKREAYVDELRDYSLQLGEKLKNWDIANTEYTYSVRSQGLLDIMLKQQNGRIDQTKWVRQEETCMGERMILYTRLNGSTSTNRIDTIRIFPDRLSDYKELPLISSYTFFGALSEKESYQIINEVREELEKLGLTKLAEILKISDNDKINNILLEHKMKFISCILSITIFFDFFSDVLSKEQLNQLTIAGDFWKISRNFGKKTDLIEEILAIRKKTARNSLHSIILNIVDSNAKELIPYNPDVVLNNGLNIDSINLDKITNIMRNVLFCVEMESQKSAYNISGSPHKFDLFNYQTKISTNNLYNCDGIITFNKLFDLEEIKQSITSSSDIYFLIFATIGLMDNQQANLNLKTFKTQNDKIILQNCITTNEQAGFYFAEKFSPLIQVLAENELHNYYSLSNRKKLFREFIISCFESKSGMRIGDEWVEINDDVRQLLIKEITSLLGEESLEHTLEKTFVDSERFYNAGFSFLGFDFDNLRTIARQRKSIPDGNSQLEECFRILIKEADEARATFIAKYTKPTDSEDTQEKGPRLVKKTT